MATIDNLMVRIGADLSGFNRAMKEASGSLQSAGQKMRDVGSTMTAGITAPVAGLAGAVVKTGADFESAMSKVQAVSGSSAQEMQKLEDQARELGSTTKFSATEAADAMGFLGMAGFDTQQIMSSMPGLLDLAASGALDLGRAADIASNVMSGFGMEAENMGHISDVLAKSAASANTSVEQMGTAMSYVAPVAKGFGISMEESAAAVGILSNAGIQGERAGTALRGIMSQLSNVSGSTADKLSELGLSAEQVNPKTHSLTEILKTLKDAGATAADAMDLVGVEAGPGLAAMLEAGDAELAEMTNNLKNADGAAKEMADTMNNNTKGSFKELMSAAQELGLQFYDVIQPALAVVIDYLKQLTSWFQNLSPQMKTIITVVLGFLAALGPLILIIGMLTSALSSIIAFIPTLVSAFKTVMTVIRSATVIFRIFNLTLLTNPIFWVIAAIIALIAVGIWLYKNWDVVKQKLAAAWEMIKAKAGAVWDWIKSKTSTIWQGIKTAVTNAVNTIKTWVTNAWENIKSATSNAWQAVKDAIQKAWDTIKSTLSGLADKALEWGKNLISSFIDGITSMFGRLKGAVEDAVGIVADFLGFSSPTKKGPGSKADRWAPNLIDMFAGGLERGSRQIQSAAFTAMNSVDSVFNNTRTAQIGAQSLVSGGEGQGGTLSNGGRVRQPVEINLTLDGQQLMPTVRRELTLDLSSVLEGAT